MKKKFYGWCYDKNGNQKEITPPINEKGKEMKKHTKTKTGALIGGIGFSMNIKNIDYGNNKKRKI